MTSSPENCPKIVGMKLRMYDGNVYIRTCTNSSVRLLTQHGSPQSGVKHGLICSPTQLLSYVLVSKCVSVQLNLIFRSTRIHLRIWEEHKCIFKVLVSQLRLQVHLLNKAWSSQSVSRLPFPALMMILKIVCDLRLLLPSWDTCCCCTNSDGMTFMWRFQQPFTTPDLMFWRGAVTAQTKKMWKCSMFRTLWFEHLSLNAIFNITVKDSTYFLPIYNFKIIEWTFQDTWMSGRCYTDFWTWSMYQNGWIYSINKI